VNVRQSIKASLRLLTRRDRRLLSVAAVIQMCTSLLDLVGVLLIGAVGALAVATLQSQPPPAIIQQFTVELGLEDLSPQSLVLFFAGAAAAVLLTKSILSSYLTRRVLMFLANRQALVSARLAKELLSRPLTFIQQRSTQETAYALISGAGAATLGVLGNAVISLSELALLAVMAGLLVFVSPWAALASIAFFALVALALQRVLGGWATAIGAALATTEIGSLRAVQEALGTYREISVSARRPLYVNRIQDLRWEAARFSADWQFVNMLPKYIFEASLVLGGLLLAGVLFTTQDSVTAVATLAVFLAAASRVMPSLLRLQGAVLGLRGVAATAAPTFRLAEELGNPLDVPEDGADPSSITGLIGQGYTGFVPSIHLIDVHFSYPASHAPVLTGISLSVDAGQSLAIVGRSGSGKSTLVDLILGVLTPNSGQALLGGRASEDSVSAWPGAVAYVPQEVQVMSGTVRENVALGIPREAISDDLVRDALDRAHLSQYLETDREGLSTLLGEGGVQLSGGQRQRLGIARALYTKPRLVVLDEATSALDAETEEAVSQTISALHGDVTTVIVAHRLSTVRDADLVVYLDEGRIIAAGSFGELLKRVPALAHQARLLDPGSTAT
jgi:ABC-type multidrug transport system fused ATPase/permease subunit